MPTLAILAFTVVALLSGLRFAALVTGPSTLRVVGMCAVAAAMAGCIGASASAPLPSGARVALRLALVALGAWLSLRCAGFSTHELWPSHWGLLTRELKLGANQLDGLWPYAGNSPQARLAIASCIAAAVLPAAALAFWPAGTHASAPRLAALALLLLLYVTAASNEPRTEWPLQGLVLLLALYLWAWSSRARRAVDARAAAWMIVGAVVCVSGSVALASGRPLISYRSWNPFGEPAPPTAFDWNQSYGPLQWPSSGQTMVLVAASAPHLWRATELDSFDGLRFLNSGHAPPEVQGLDELSRNRQWVTSATFTVRGLSSSLLLSPGQILSTGITGSSLPRLQAGAADGTQALTATVPTDAHYTITAYAPDPSPAELRLAPRAFPPQYLPYVQFALPSPSSPMLTSPTSAATAPGRALLENSPYAGVYALARRLARSASNEYDVTQRLMAFFAHGFTYNTDPPSHRYPLAAFLLSDRVGYCQQFSGAMTLMLRMDGIPARVAAGFTTGSRKSTGGPYLVTARDAHSWVEVFFPHIGWVVFDPTPTQPTRSALRGEAGARLTPAQASAAARRRSPSAQAHYTRATGSTKRQKRADRLSGALWASLAGALLLLLALLSASLLHRRRRQREQSSGAHGEAAIAELLRALERLGLTAAPDATLLDIETQLHSSHGSHAGHYVHLLSNLRYAPAADAPPSPRERRLLRSALTAGRGPLAHARGLFALPPRLRGRG
jgi:hypothetical protein